MLLVACGGVEREAQQDLPPTSPPVTEITPIPETTAEDAAAGTHALEAAGKPIDPGAAAPANRDSAASGAPPAGLGDSSTELGALPLLFRSFNPSSHSPDCDFGDPFSPCQ